MPSEEHAAVVDALRTRVRAGLSRDGAIRFLHDEDLPIVASIRAIHEVFGLSLDEAKFEVAGHPVWARMAKAAKPLHELLERVADLESESPEVRARARRALVAGFLPALGLPPIPEDWSGLDAVRPLLERMRQEGAVVELRWAGESTVVASGGLLAGDVLRAEERSLEDALARVLFDYALRFWRV